MADEKKLKREIKKLRYQWAVERYKRKQAEKSMAFWRKIVAEQDDEIEQLTAPKVVIALNGKVVTDGR